MQVNRIALVKSSLPRSPVIGIAYKIIPVPMSPVSTSKNSRFVEIQGIRILGGNSQRIKGSEKETEIVQGRLHPNGTHIFTPGGRIHKFKDRVIDTVIGGIEFLFRFRRELPDVAQVFFIDGGPQVFGSILVPHPQNHLTVILGTIIVGEGPQGHHRVKAHDPIPLHVIPGPAAVVTPVAFPVLPTTKRGKPEEGNQQQKQPILVPGRLCAPVGKDSKQYAHRAQDSSGTTRLEHSHEQSRHAVKDDKGFETAPPKTPFLEPRQSQQVPGRNKHHVRRNPVFHLGSHHPPQGKWNNGPVGKTFLVQGRRLFQPPVKVQEAQGENDSKREHLAGDSQIHGRKHQE